MKYLNLIILLAGMIVLDQTAGATPVTTTATADTFVDSAQANSNFGGAGAVQLTAPGNSKGQMVSLLKFDLSSITASFNTADGTGDWSPTSLTLTLTTNFGSQGVQPNNPIFAPINAGSFEMRLMQNTDWIEGTGTPATPTTDGITYNQLSTYISASDISLGTFSWTAAGNGNYNFSLPMNSALVSEITSGQTISLELLSADSGVSFLFNTKTQGNPAEFSVDAMAVPEPSIGYMMIAGLFILAGLRWCKGASQ